MQQTCIDEVERLTSLRDARVVDIGCDPDLNVALWLAHHYRVRSVVGVNLAKAKRPTSSLPECVSYLQRNACATGLPDGCADIVLGLAVLEHIHDMVGFAREVERLLRPGGVFLVWGGWFRTFSQGTHVYFEAKNGIVYRYNDKKATLIQPWEHLLVDQPTLSRRLEERGLDSEDAAALAKQVYDLQHLNCLAPSQVEEIFRAQRSLRFHVKRGMADDTPPTSLPYSREDLNTYSLTLIGNREG